MSEKRKNLFFFLDSPTNVVLPNSYFHDKSDFNSTLDQSVIDLNVGGESLTELNTGENNFNPILNLKYTLDGMHV